MISPSQGSRVAPRRPPPRNPNWRHRDRRSRLNARSDFIRSGMPPGLYSETSGEGDVEFRARSAESGFPPTPALSGLSSPAPVLARVGVNPTPGWLDYCTFLAAGEPSIRPLSFDQMAPVRIARAQPGIPRTGLDPSSRALRGSGARAVDPRAFRMLKELRDMASLSKRTDLEFRSFRNVRAATWRIGGLLGCAWAPTPVASFRNLLCRHSRPCASPPFVSYFRFWPPRGTWADTVNTVNTDGSPKPSAMAYKSPGPPFIIARRRSPSLRVWRARRRGDRTRVSSRGLGAPRWVTVLAARFPLVALRPHRMWPLEEVGTAV